MSKLSPAAIELEARRIVSDAIPHTEPAGLLLFAKTGSPLVAYAVARLVMRTMRGTFEAAPTGNSVPLIEAIDAEVERTLTRAAQQPDYPSVGAAVRGEGEGKP